MNKKGYISEKLSFYRPLVIASVRQSKNSAIHCVTEVDVTLPRKLIREHEAKSGIKISFTAAQALPAKRMGDLAGAAWIRFIPSTLSQESF